MDERRRRDCWSEWLLHRRFGGDAEVQRQTMEHLRAGRDRVLAEPPEPVAWDVFLDTAWNPKIPTLREVMLEVLSAAERDCYTAHLRPLVEQGLGRRRMAVSYLVARKAA